MKKIVLAMVLSACLSGVTEARFIPEKNQPAVAGGITLGQDSLIGFSVSPGFGITDRFMIALAAGTASSKSGAITNSQVNYGLLGIGKYDITNDWSLSGRYDLNFGKAKAATSSGSIEKDFSGYSLAAAAQYQVTPELMPWISQNWVSTTVSGASAVNESYVTFGFNWTINKNFDAEVLVKSDLKQYGIGGTSYF